MRLCRPIALGLTAAALAVVPGSPAPAAVGPHPATCQSASASPTTAASAPETPFPLDTHIHEGPDAYASGDGYQTWSLDLVSRAASTCTRVHPVLVLVDRTRQLRPDHIRMEFRAGGRWHPVRFERTDRAENIGVFAGDSPGFTVAPGATVTVDVRLAFTPDAPDDHVVATAALVRRERDDGDWVGESGGYAFDVVAEDGGADADGDGAVDGSGAWSGDEPGSDRPGQLARTGRQDAVLRALGAAAAALVLSGTALVVGARTRRRRHPRRG
ncbi:hypothetical protein [Streptomyces beihaiensis]|uniref:Gram-positive cocci surface proteins LPxTG domain-containing protein n=1 Tax=Streptomyces beihaiensis TaxID=2984495 RepID=A0ABT3TWM6_9ACTN|nr:hypothetical protein [Streptomyces beihaiensis]MCX3061446.1 hypothetical protein [Streptomyces beihaiensis]